MLACRRCLRSLLKPAPLRTFTTHAQLLHPKPRITAVRPKLPSPTKEDDASETRGVRIPNPEGGQSITTRDPLVFLSSVNTLLDRGDVETARELIRRNLRDIKTLPSWNRIIEYYLERQNPTEALKIYNDMKKRGVLPDSFTYAGILRGISKLPIITPKIVSSARSVYESIEKPLILHTNLMLSIYKKANAVDEMWPLVSKLGNHEIDKATYSILFDALATEEDPVEAAEDGLRAWSGILSRWSRGGFDVDDQVVSSLMFLLARSTQESHWEEVFKIAETMFPTLDFGAGGMRRPAGVQTPQYTEKVLIPLLKAANNLKSVDRAEKAWSLYRGAAPTITTHHAFLYTLQSVRAADKAHEFLERMISKGTVKPDKKAFVVALRTCYIHAARPPFLNKAEKMLELAEKTLGRLNDEILQTFLNLFLASKAPDDVKRGLKTIRPHLANLKLQKGKEREILVDTINAALKRGVTWAPYEEPQWKLMLAQLEGKSEEEIKKLKELARQGDYKERLGERGTRPFKPRDREARGRTEDGGRHNDSWLRFDDESGEIKEDKSDTSGKDSGIRRKWDRRGIRSREETQFRTGERAGREKGDWSDRRSSGSMVEKRPARVYETLDRSKGLKYDSSNPDAFVVKQDRPFRDRGRSNSTPPAGSKNSSQRMRGDFKWR